MKKAVLILFVSFIVATNVSAQEKGVDKQNESIINAGTNRGPGNNGINQDTGIGRGFDFGKGRTPASPALPNPFRLTARRDAIMKGIEDLMRDRKLILDTDASKPDEGILISQPYTFIRGAVVTASELSQYADVPSANARGWTRARYTIIVEVQPIDDLSSNVSVNAKIEGRTDGASGAEWISLRSTGTAEQEFLKALVENLTGGLPTTNSKP